MVSRADIARCRNGSRLAILGAREHADLETLTEAVIANPATACRITESEWCYFVPLGVVVRLKMPSPMESREMCADLKIDPHDL